MTSRVGLSKRYMSDPVNWDDRKLFEKKCKDMGISTGKALACFIKAFPKMTIESDGGA